MYYLNLALSPMMGKFYELMKTVILIESIATGLSM